MTEEWVLLFKPYAIRLLRASQDFFGGPDPECGDMVRDTFLVAASLLGNREPTEPLYPWLRQICLRLCYSRRRTRGAILVCLDKDLNIYMRAQDITKVHSDQPGVLDHQKLVVLREMIKPLDPDSRQILQLRNVNGLTYAQVARILDIPQEVVTQRLTQAMAQLRRAASIPKPSTRPAHRPLMEAFGLNEGTP